MYINKSALKSSYGDVMSAATHFLINEIKALQH